MITAKSNELRAMSNEFLVAVEAKSLLTAHCPLLTLSGEKL
ncbi:MAG: hypothetical protein V4702_02245 [Patescibacteria group bacterium]